MSILRNGLVSPTRATFMLQRTASTRSILKHPGALLRSPAHPRSVCFSIQPLERTHATSEDFKLSAPPRPFRSVSSALKSPAITDFEDPRSPKVQVAAKQRNLLRFAALTSKQTASRPSQTLANSLASYPRSPYPSAPLVPNEYTNDEVTMDSPTHRVRASSINLPKRNKKGLTLGSAFVTSVVPAPSSPGRTVFSPACNEGQLPAPLDLESRLNEAFWNAVSLEESDDEVMVTALEYPSSSVEPQIMYASNDGALWSPALPKPGVAVSKIRESLMSPSNGSSFSAIVRKDFTAPTPNDPFAAFPSFAAAMKENSDIAYSSGVVFG